jgi:hypothetical protein
MSSRSKNRQPPKRKPRNWTSTLYVIFGLIMVIAMVVSAVAR